jgi:hypothetical protein
MMLYALGGGLGGRGPPRLQFPEVLSHDELHPP